MPIQQPGRGGGIQGRGVSARCGQGGHGSSFFAIARNRGGLGRTPVFATKQSRDRFGLSGITKDSTGAVLAGCTVDCFSESDVFLAQTVSDGIGAFAFTGLGVGTVYLRAYLAGVPDVAGTTNVVPVVTV